MTMDVAAAGTAVRRGSKFNDPRLRAIFYQVVLLLVVVGIGWFLVSNLIHNREVRGIQTGYGFLNREAGFAISETPISYSPSDTYARAFLVGLANTLKVSILGIILATLLGLVVGVSKLSSNWLLAKLAAGYVDLVRNIPLTVQLLLWAGLIRVSAPAAAAGGEPGPGRLHQQSRHPGPVDRGQPDLPVDAGRGAGGAGRRLGHRPLGAGSARRRPGSRSTASGSGSACSSACRWWSGWPAARRRPSRSRS